MKIWFLQQPIGQNPSQGMQLCSFSPNPLEIPAIIIALSYFGMFSEKWILSQCLTQQIEKHYLIQHNGI